MVNGPPANLTALDGKDATIPCEAEGAPAPNITWYLDGEWETGCFCLKIFRNDFVKLTEYPLLRIS